MKSCHFEPLHRLAAFLDKFSSGPPSERFSHKVYKYSLRRPFRHMRTGGPRFFMSEPDAAGARKLFWDGQQVGSTQPHTKIRDSQKGHCFIVATGPSLKDIDLKLLKDHPTFGINGAVAKFTEAGIAPTYYAINDDDFFENRFPMVRDVVTARSKCFFSFGGLSRICELGPELLSQTDFYLLEVLNRNYAKAGMPVVDYRRLAATDPDKLLPVSEPTDKNLIGFSRDVAKGVFGSRTVLYMALQLAYYIGYRKLYILGMDLNYQGPNPRFYETTTQARPTRIDRDFEPHILPAFRMVQELCKKGELEVYNLSPTSRMPEEIIPRLTFAEAVAGGKR